MKRLVPLVLAAALVLPASASARVIELGAGGTPNAKPDCPLPEQCQAVGQVTGYQGRSGSLKSPFVVKRDGVIVAFTVSLGNPSDKQKTFFDGLYGGPPQVRLSILRKGKKRKSRLDHRLMSQSRRYSVDRYFGSSPTFAFSRPLQVHKGYIVALTVPTWAPVFSPRLTRTNWWRSSRAMGKCNDVSQKAAQETRRLVMRYGCTYHTARLLYTATYIPDPKRTDTRSK
jgi:hypothetical protein